MLIGEKSATCRKVKKHFFGALAWLRFAERTNNRKQQHAASNKANQTVCATKRAAVAGMHSQDLRIRGRIKTENMAVALSVAVSNQINFPGTRCISVERVGRTPVPVTDACF